MSEFDDITQAELKSYQARIDEINNLIKERAKKENISVNELFDKHKKEIYCTTRNCWKCKREIKIYCWYPHTTPFKRNSPPIDIKTIKLRRTDVVEEVYYVNTCEYCDASQGDFFIYCEVDSIPQCELCALENERDGLEGK